MTEGLLVRVRPRPSESAVRPAPFATWDPPLNIALLRRALTARAASADGQVPLIGRFFPAPVAAKVPEVIFVFWVVKILTTAGGEATSDYLKTYGNFKGGGVEVLVIVVGLLLQFATRRYRAFAYWFLAYAIAITGTGVSDFLHLDVHIPYAGTTLLWAVILAAIFWALAAQRGHALDPQHHHPATRGFLLGDGVRDLCPRHRARRLHRDLAQPGLPGLGHPLRRRHPDPGPGAMAARPEQHRRVLDVLRRHAAARCVLRRLHQQAPHISGINFGDGPTAIVFAVAVFVLVSYLALARPDIQKPLESLAPRPRTAPPPDLLHTAGPEIELD